MTAIACKIEKDAIHIASDTQTTWGSLKYTSRNKSDKHYNDQGKIFRVKDTIIAAAGCVATHGALAIYLKSHKCLKSSISFNLCTDQLSPLQLSQPDI